MDAINITSPLEAEVIEKLRVGDRVLISGLVYTARDAAHKRLVQAIVNGEKLPFNLEGQTLYYMGPSPARPGQVIGSAGPTTSSRMDIYTPPLLALGLRAMIGKGSRSQEVKEAIKRHRVVYFVTIGGAGALLSKAIKKAKVIAYPELATEAIMRLELEGFPAIVANDIYGSDLFIQGRASYRKEEI
ncbi:MAG: Fe-S-containing hydro-lyase [Dehalococcoidales bacterium]|nr:Fe-S-containing hydro-lyase [Dehalococcoidales bacterium]